MTADEPEIFKNMTPYMRTRLMMASAILFRLSDWKEFSYGHEKLLGVVLWQYENKKEIRFKYNKLFKKQAYGRTQNYVLLKPIVEKNILFKEGNGYYRFPEKYHPLLGKILEILKLADNLKDGMEGEQE